MKKLLAIFSLTLGLSVLAPATAQAGHNASYRSSSRQCNSCGGEIYRQRVVVGYDRCGEPIYDWRTASHRCQPRHDSGHGHGRGGGHGHGGGHSSGHSHHDRTSVHLDFGGHRRH